MEERCRRPSARGVESRISRVAQVTTAVSRNTLSVNDAQLLMACHGTAAIARRTSRPVVCLKQHAA